jgi:hypothetical protein
MILPVIYEVLFVLDLVVMISALVDCLCTDEHTVRHLPKVGWVLVILLVSPVGGIVWFLAGRPQHRPAPRHHHWRPGSGFPEYERPRPRRAPDDDPAFLAGLGRPTGSDEDLLRRWEADLRRREDELRRRQGRPDAE